MAVSNPFAIFPKEIWTMILDNFEYYDEKVNIIKAYPELATVIRNYKLMSLFVQIVPHIAEWVKEKDLLACRRVCKLWSIGLDSFFENHPYHRAYQPDPEGNNTASWDLAEYSNCYHGQRFPEVNSMYRRHLSNEYAFEDRNFLNFNRIMEGHPTDRNPFVGRSITVNPGSSACYYNADYQCRWYSAPDFIQRWGEHIWYIGLITNQQHEPREFLQLLQRILCHLPNLKGLTLSGRLKYLHRPTTWEDFIGGSNFPELPHLETFKFFLTGVPQLASILMTHYSTQIQRVQFNFAAWEWISKYLTNVPNLRELEMTGIVLEWDDKWRVTLDEVLLNLKSPQLHRLQIICKSMKRQDRLILPREDILHWLRQFPSLRHFEFPNEQIIIPDLGCPPDPEDFAFSIESISLFASTLNLAFLLSFPRLSCLQILFQHDPIRNGESAAERFQDCIRSAELGNIWEVLPKLNTVILVDNALGFRERISRPESIM